MHRSSWSIDPFARGSFTFPAVGASPDHRAALAKPVLDRMFFAGEATALTEPGTVQGARESGLRAATQLQEVSDPSERIVVVGAGIAGLTAATRLREAGYDITIVEARERVGGRIETITEGWPNPIELGPSFVLGSTESTLDEEFAALGVSTLPFSRVPEVHTRSREIVPLSPIGAEAVAEALAFAATQPQDESVERALVDSGESALSDSLDAEGLSDADWLEYEVSTRLKITSSPMRPRPRTTTSSSAATPACSPPTPPPST